MSSVLSLRIMLSLKGIMVLMLLTVCTFFVFKTGDVHATGAEVKIEDGSCEVLNSSGGYNSGVGKIVKTPPDVINATCHFFVENDLREANRSFRGAECEIVLAYDPTFMSIITTKTYGVLTRSGQGHISCHVPLNELIW